MAASARELVGWTDTRWIAVQDAVDKALARTSKCRQVVPKEADQIGAKAVVVPNIGAGYPLAYGADTIATPVHVYFDVRLDDDHVDNDEDILRLIHAGASQLGVLEDEEIIHGAPSAVVALVAAAPGRGVRAARNPALLRYRIGRAPGVAAGGPGTTAIGAALPVPTGQEIITAIARAVAALETAVRPGPCGLLLNNQLLAVLRVPPVAGAAPLVQQVDQLIGSSEIAGTSTLDGPLVAGGVCGILLRLEPAAVDLVQTQKPTVTVLDRAGGQSNLRIEEEVVVRVTDQAAVHRIEY
jgi:uncharacterized linocin/CFP29 family protein